MKATRYALAQEVKHLTLPGEMGERFQVMAFTRGIEAGAAAGRRAPGRSIRPAVAAPCSRTARACASAAMASMRARCMASPMAGPCSPCSRNGAAVTRPRPSRAARR